MCIYRCVCVCVCLSKLEKKYICKCHSRASSIFLSLHCCIISSALSYNPKPAALTHISISTTDAIVRFWVRTKSTATYIALTMDYALRCRPTTTVAPVTVATVTVYCTDGIGPLTTGSTAALDTFFGKVDGLAANRPLPDSSSIRASMPYACANVAAARRTYRIVCHNRRHRSISNCTGMAFVRRPQMRPAEHVHMRPPPILERPTTVTHTILRWYGRIANNRPDTVRTMLCSSCADLAHSRYSTDHGKRPTSDRRAPSSVDN